MERSSGQSPGRPLPAAAQPVILVPQGPPRPVSPQGSASCIRSQRVLADITSCPRIFGGSTRDLVSLPFRVYMNSPGGNSASPFYSGPPYRMPPTSRDLLLDFVPCEPRVVALPLSEIWFPTAVELARA